MFDAFICCLYGMTTFRSKFPTLVNIPVYFCCLVKEMVLTGHDGIVISDQVPCLLLTSIVGWFSNYMECDRACARLVVECNMMRMLRSLLPIRRF
jgi:hypothetical protein